MRASRAGRSHHAFAEAGLSSTPPAKKRKASEEACDTPPKRRASEGAIAPRQSVPARVTELQLASPPTRKVLVGGGPRTTTQVCAELDLLEERADDFRRVQSAGGRYDIQRVVIERQDVSYLGRGNAWGPNQGGGTVNTGHEMAGVDYAKRLAGHATRHRARLQALYRHNPVAGSLLQSAFSGPGAPGDGTPDTSRGMMGRREQGEEELQHFERRVQHATHAFPFYRLDVLPHTSVDAIDLTRPEKPAVIVSDAEDGRPLGTVPAGVVRLNTGTTPAPPVSGEALMQYTHAEPMGELDGFLQSRGLLDVDGKLKPGTRLALGGTGLSALDQVIALHSAMDLFEPDPHSIAGYRVSDSARQKYAGAITFVSRHEGQWVPPRHVTKDCAWTQKTDALGDSRELHAAFLHGNGEAVFTDWHQVMRGSIALALDMAPEQVDERGLTTAQLLAAQHERTALHVRRMNESAGLDGDERRRKIDESMQTLEGAKRQAYLQAILGLGMERDPGLASDALSQEAPVTYRGRSGYLIHRAQHAAITTPQQGKPPHNAAPLAALGEWLAHITSSPVQVQEMAHMLFEAGIATHVEASYDDFRADEADDGKPLALATADGTLRFDAFIVSPTLQRRAEPAVRSLSGQVEPVHPDVPDLPKLVSGRRIVAKGGQPSHVEDYGLNGKGATVPGTQSRVGGFALDVNNRESATDVAPGLALRDMAAEHLAAAGVENPFELLAAMYEEELPSHDDYDAEVVRFAPHHQSLAVKAEFLRAAEQAAQGEAGRFASLARTARSGSRVRAQGALLEPLIKGPQREADRFRGPSAQFADAMDAREPFKPAPRDEYFARFVDAPLHVHEAVYGKALAHALDVLRQKVG